MRSICIRIRLYLHKVLQMSLHFSLKIRNYKMKNNNFTGIDGKSNYRNQIEKCKGMKLYQRFYIKFKI